MCVCLLQYSDVQSKLGDVYLSLCRYCGWCTTLRCLSSSGSSIRCVSQYGRIYEQHLSLFSVSPPSLNSPDYVMLLNCTQGGLTRMLSKLNQSLAGLSSPVTVVFHKTYMPPRFLLADALMSSGMPTSSVSMYACKLLGNAECVSL